MCQFVLQLINNINSSWRNLLASSSQVVEMLTGNRCLPKYQIVCTSHGKNDLNSRHILRFVWVSQKKNVLICLATKKTTSTAAANRTYFFFHHRWTLGQVVHKMSLIWLWWFTSNKTTTFWILLAKSIIKFKLLSDTWVIIIGIIGYYLTNDTLSLLSKEMLHINFFFQIP